jgi:hypothetical protein
MKYIRLFEDFRDYDFNYGSLSATDIDKVKLYISDLKKEASENNINLILSPNSGVAFTTDESSILCNGYFDGDTRTLACAMGKDLSYWLIILIHESCHMDQFLEGVSEWTENIGLDETDKWLSGNDNVDMNKIDEEIRTSMIIEIDCEKRTVDKIKKYELDSLIDITEYIQKSNAYILFYLWMRKNRKWYTIGREPYSIPEVISAMPTTFNVDYNKLDINIEKIFDTYL